MANKERMDEFNDFFRTLSTMKEQEKENPGSAFKALQETGLVNPDGSVVWRSEILITKNDDESERTKTQIK